MSPMSKIIAQSKMKEKNNECGKELLCSKCRKRVLYHIFRRPAKTVIKDIEKRPLSKLLGFFPVFFCRFVCDKNAEIVQNQAGIDFLCILSGFDLNNAKLQEIKMTVGILCVDCRKCEVMQIDQMAS